VGVSRWPGSERFDDRLQYAGAVGENLVVPEAENAPALRSQRGVSAVVVAGAGMLAAIGFDDQASFKADEIDNIRGDRKLASEAPAEAAAAQFSAQRLLGIRRVSSQFASPVPHREPAAHVIAA
jgi:hypothetical protein